MRPAPQRSLPTQLAREETRPRNITLQALAWPAASLSAIRHSAGWVVGPSWRVGLHERRRREVARLVTGGNVGVRGVWQRHPRTHLPTQRSQRYLGGHLYYHPAQDATSHFVLTPEAILADGWARQAPFRLLSSGGSHRCCVTQSR
jgi:hypothetical protein